ncbi:hypothetical protein ACQF36_22705 [Streptomyces sp. Marseille-Q5077]|uniref:hypothetical protein n=1 Tax=Streptomyces sp. Marseille-Q5077 TaxID=3418995 RepID=UPI003CFF7EDC
MPQSSSTLFPQPADKTEAHENRDGYGRFIVLEGLSAVGKSTVAPLLAQSLDAVAMPTLLPEFEHVRKEVDKKQLAMPRLHFWMMTNYAVSETIQHVLRHGQDVVVESYFYRTLATHDGGHDKLPIGGHLPPH